MAKIQLDEGFALHCQQLGTGPDVVMVHGITGNLAIWHLEIIPALMGSYRFTTYDLRGHGYSDMPPTGYTTADHAGDLLRLLDRLEIERAAILAHSFGADVSLHFAILHPERVERLALVEPAVQALAHLRERPEWVGWGYWRQKLRQGGVEIPDEKQYDEEFLVRQSINIPKVFGFRKGMQRRAAPLVRLMETTTAAADYREQAGMTLERIAEVRHPVLLVYGAESVFLSSFEALKDILPDCTPLLIPETEHYGPLEQPAQLIAALREFLPAGAAAHGHTTN